jgi:cytoskeleton protein RodZ
VKVVETPKAVEPAKVVEVPKVVAPAPPPPPAAPPSNTVQVSVSSNPSGARVLVNGKSAGQTPLTLSWQKGQRLKLDFSASGFKPAGKVLSPTEDAAVEVNLKRSGPKPPP